MLRQGRGNGEVGGLFNSDELRNAIERLPPEQYLAASYYERWLGALEMLVAEKGVLP